MKNYLFYYLILIFSISLFLIYYYKNHKKYSNLHFIGLLILGVHLAGFGSELISTPPHSSGPKYEGRYEICGSSDVVSFYLDADGTCNNGKGSENGGIYGNWEKTSNGIVISGMGSNWDGNYMLDGTTDGVALKKGNIRYCNPSYR